MSAVAAGRRRGPLPVSLKALVVGVALAVAVGVAAAANPFVAVGGALLLLFATAICVRPESATLLVIGILYSNAAAVAVKQHGVPLAVGAIFPMLLLAPVLYRVFVRREPFAFLPVLPWLLAYFGTNVLSAAFARDPGTVHAEVATLLVEGLVLFVLVTNVVRDSRTLRRALWLVVAVGAVLGGLSVLQQVTKTYGNSYLGFAQVTVNNPGFHTGELGYGETFQKRLGGPIGDENRYAQVLLALVPFALFFAVRPGRLLWRLVAAGSLALICAGIALTFSRGAALGFVVIVLLALLTRTIRIRHALLVAGIVAVLISAVPYYATRLSSFMSLGSLGGATTEQSRTDPSVRSRSTENLVAGLMFLDHPLLGVGPGEYPNTYRTYADRAQDYSNELDVRLKASRRQPHNMWLGILAETGLLGFSAFVGMVVVTVRRLLRARRVARLAQRPELAALATAMLLSFCSYLVTGTFLQLSYARYFFLLLALSAAAASIVVREASPQAPPVRIPRTSA